MKHATRIISDMKKLTTELQQAQFEEDAAALRHAQEIGERNRNRSMDSFLRDILGKEVRHVWIVWAREQPNCKPSWTVPWDGLSEPDREVDRRIGETLYRLGQKSMAEVVHS